MKACPTNRQAMLFSATHSEQVCLSVCLSLLPLFSRSPFLSSPSLSFLFPLAFGWMEGGQEGTCESLSSHRQSNNALRRTDRAGLSVACLSVLPRPLPFTPFPPLHSLQVGRLAGLSLRHPRHISVDPLFSLVHTLTQVRRRRKGGQKEQKDDADEDDKEGKEEKNGMYG